MKLSEALEEFDEDYVRRYPIKFAFERETGKVAKRETKDIDRLGLFH